MRTKWSSIIEEEVVGFIIMVPLTSKYQCYGTLVLLVTMTNDMSAACLQEKSKCCFVICHALKLEQTDYMSAVLYVKSMKGKFLIMMQVKQKGNITAA